MASDYVAIRRDNKRRYGTDIGRIGRLLLADRYDERTHFIFELLQNAEDALGRRPGGWEGSRAVSFHLTEKVLRIEHCGVPFDERDVRAICGIAESTKGLTAIGRFGIGFKSVYAITERPEVHSGAEAFAIESYVWPVSVTPIERDPETTVILLPLKKPAGSHHEELARALGRLDPSALLFLRQIEEIKWSVVGGPSGLYLRESTEIEPCVRRTTVIGQRAGQEDVSEEWLIFSQAVSTDEGRRAGFVELAFQLTGGTDSNRERIRRVARSPLVVFFPTVVETHLGFLVQGPCRTTPSRDNVPRHDAWNQHLVRETAVLLRKALLWLRDNDLLDTAALRCLPLDPTKFADDSMFAPLYDATKSALSTEELLPRADSGHVSAEHARLGRTKELRELITPAQLAALHGEEGELAWLSGEITQDRTPELRRYLMQELGIEELTPEDVVPRLTEEFLERQSDDWIIRLYEFLSGQRALRRHFDDLPLVRLENGVHVPAVRDGQAQAFLPGPVASGFPLVRATICASDTAVEFLRSLGLTEPDPVDDVVRNVLPKYQEDEVDVSEEEYAADIERILHAFGTDSKSRREALIGALRETPWVAAVDAGNGSTCRAKPMEVYLATERLRALFAGIEGVLLVDTRVGCLRGEKVRELLEAAGATRHLQPVAVECELSRKERREIRRKAGLERATWEEPIHDVSLRGLEEVFAHLQTLDPEARRERGRLLWEALEELHDRRGSRVFETTYRWSYSHETKTATFDAAFVRALNEHKWVPDAKGDLRQPALILFNTLGWQPNPFLLSKIRFKPPILDQLAQEAGIEPGVLDLLKRRGITSEAQLRQLLGVEEEETDSGDGPGNVDEALEKLGISETPTPPVPDPTGDHAGLGASGGGAGRGTGTTLAGDRKQTRGARDRGNTGPQGTHAGRSVGKRTPAGVGGGPFISYVAVHPDEEEPDPDGLDQATRMALEGRALEFIVANEPEWKRTPAHNPGFDLFEAGPDGQPVRWCEVKAMTGSLDDRPVGLSRTQFECAQEHGSAYWLYVVEHAGTENPRIVRIQDPAGKARTFTFDRGWLAVAQVDTESGEREE